MLIDSHCHLDFNDFEEDFEDILARARENGVTAMLNAGNNIGELDNVKAEDFVEKSGHKKIVGIGECGLDYYYDYSPKDIQQKVFIEQIKAAQQTSLPLIVHTRDADDDTISILGDYYKKAPFTGEIHCFSTSKKLADFALSIGFYISASGIITFNRSAELREIFREIPTERLLVETDSPFLAPIPLRGRRNEPSFVVHTAEKLAQLKDIPFEKLAQITSDNFYRLFRKASDKGRYEY